VEPEKPALGTGSGLSDSGASGTLAVEVKLGFSTLKVLVRFTILNAGTGGTGAGTAALIILDETTVEAESEVILVGGRKTETIGIRGGLMCNAEGAVLVLVVLWVSEGVALGKARKEGGDILAAVQYQELYVRKPASEYYALKPLALLGPKPNVGDTGDPEPEPEQNCFRTVFCSDLLGAVMDGRFRQRLDTDRVERDVLVSEVGLGVEDTAACGLDSGAENRR